MTGRGRLEVFTGPMFAGKSAHLIDAANRFGDRGLVLKPAFDTRDGTHVISSRANLSCDARPAASWPEDFVNYDAVIIDEIQFMMAPHYDGDVVQDIRKALELGINIVAGGLDTDYNRTAFAIVSELAKTADRHVQLRARCHTCGDAAMWTSKRSETGKRLELGDDDLYEARCDAHWSPPES